MNRQRKKERNRPHGFDVAPAQVTNLFVPPLDPHDSDGSTPARPNLCILPMPLTDAVIRPKRRLKMEHPDVLILNPNP
jgi:hypothetical protein